MPVYVSFQNGTAAAGVLVYANLTDNPTVSQSGYTDSNGTIIFTHVPLRTVALFARTIDNQIALIGIATTPTGISLVIIPFGTVVSPNTTANSISKAPSSNEQFLRRITKQDVELPGFTVDTLGQTLQMVSKTFMREKNSTGVYVRYKFVTSEVPGGFFGTQFNDYFSVTIRSQSGYYTTISQSMNASGATNWYTLKLEVSKDPELIQVDVGVANVGDSAYQSHVIVDKIGIEKSEKCDDCDKCQSEPMCRDTCMNPPMKSCLFYTDCMEAKLTGKDYLPTIIVRISKAIVLATPVLKLQLLIMLQVFKSLE